jgi:subtilase family serine protease
VGLWQRGSSVVAACAFLALAATGASAAGPAKRHGERVCGTVTGRVAACGAEVVANAGGTPLATATYQSGYAPNDLLSAYNVAGAALTNGATQTVAIVDAYDAPTAEADLGVYRAQFGLSPCTSANGCFRKVNQDGGTTPPAADPGWAQEVSLDLDVVSAVCPSCHILLVEANSASFADLAAAVDGAAAMGATQISNSYGGSEQYGNSYESHYNHPGIDIVASSGDTGFGIQFPASSPHVTAVGGTRLVKDSSSPRGWTETVWTGAGSGCSGLFSKPSFQSDSGCLNRSVADVSAVADPTTGVAVYDSYPYSGAQGWFVFGGTSVAAPVIAAVDALAGGRSPGTTYGGFAYAHPSLFNDIVSGTNGSCGGTYLCTGAPGYDGPTGVGSPNGAG